MLAALFVAPCAAQTKVTRVSEFDVAPSRAPPWPPFNRFTKKGQGLSANRVHVGPGPVAHEPGRSAANEAAVRLLMAA